MRNPLATALTDIAAAVAPGAVGQVRALACEKNGHVEVVALARRQEILTQEAFTERYGERGVVVVWLVDTEYSETVFYEGERHEPP